MIYQKDFRIKITNKRVGKKWYNLFFKTYILSFIFVQNDVPASRSVTIEQYDSVTIGEEVTITMYSKDNTHWFFTEKEIN